MNYPFKKILCPIDFDDNSIAALDTAAEMARQSSAVLVVLHVVPMIIQPGETPIYVDVYAAEEQISRDKLIALAKDMKKAGERGASLGLNEDETAFYDALEVNDSAVQVLGEPTLKTIARELVIAVKNNVTIDWTVRENVRANLRVIVKRILRKYGYPPDKQELATRTVLEQAELLSQGWAPAA